MGFTPTVIQEFGRRLIVQLLRDAMPVALAVIPSEQLREKLTPRVHSPTEGDLFLTPYWALMVHDGHGAIAPVKSTFLIYYRNREDDPRRPGGRSPDRLADERRLTAREFQAGLAENRRRRQLNPGGGPNQFMIIVQDSRGRPANSGPHSGTPFFEMMDAFEDSAEDTIYDEVDKFILRELSDETDEGTQRPITFEF